MGFFRYFCGSLACNFLWAIYPLKNSNWLLYSIQRIDFFIIHPLFNKSPHEKLCEFLWPISATHQSSPPHYYLSNNVIKEVSLISVCVCLRRPNHYYLRHSPWSIRFNAELPVRHPASLRLYLEPLWRNWAINNFRLWIFTTKGELEIAPAVKLCSCRCRKGSCFLLCLFTLSHLCPWVIEVIIY